MLIFSTIMFVWSLFAYFSTWSLVKEGDYSSCILFYVISTYGGIVGFVNVSCLKLATNITAFYFVVIVSFTLYLISCRYTINLFNKVFPNAKALKRLILIRFFIVINSLVFIFWIISFYGVFIYKNGILPASELYINYVQTYLVSFREAYLLCYDLFVTGLIQLFTVNTVDTWVVFCNSYSVVCCSFFIATVLNILINVFNISKT